MSTSPLHGFAHTFPDDLDVMLVGPAGQRAMLMSDAGGERWRRDANLELVFDDEADRAAPRRRRVHGRQLPARRLRGGRPVPRARTEPRRHRDLALRLRRRQTRTEPGSSSSLMTHHVDQGALEGGWSAAHHDDRRRTRPGLAPEAGRSSGPDPLDDSRCGRHQPTRRSTASSARRPERTASSAASPSRQPVREGPNGTVTGSTVRLSRKGSTKAVAAAVRYHRTTRTDQHRPGCAAQGRHHATRVVADHRASPTWPATPWTRSRPRPACRRRCGRSRPGDDGLSRRTDQRARSRPHDGSGLAASAQSCGGSKEDVRAIPAARPLAAITTAILREASSIISSPSMTAPRMPPASDVCQS